MHRDLEAAGLPLGDYDDVAHAALANAPPKMRAEADRKAGIAQFLLTGGKALSWPDKVRGCGKVRVDGQFAGLFNAALNSR